MPRLPVPFYAAAGVPLLRPAPATRRLTIMPCLISRACLTQPACLTGICGHTAVLLPRACHLQYPLLPLPYTACLSCCQLPSCYWFFLNYLRLHRLRSPQRALCYDTTFCHLVPTHGGSRRYHRSSVDTAQRRRLLTLLRSNSTRSYAHITARYGLRNDNSRYVPLP